MINNILLIFMEINSSYFYCFYLTLLFNIDYLANIRF